MKVSYQWLRQYADFDWSPEDLANRLTLCGLEVEGVELFESVKGGLEGVVVGHVLSVRQHPNADRLRLCKVDVGQGTILDIVCGAPNVAEGQKVPLALVGTTLYPTSGEPITLKESKIRGELSQGMICAEDELGLGESHAGILVLPPDLVPGTPAAEVFGIVRDHTLEIGLTANRVDAASHYGVARDIAALQGARARMPQAPAFPTYGPCPIGVELPEPEKCPLYVGIHVRGVQVTASPAWLQNRLKSIGLRPINNVVDITNFVLHELGHPLHAFDANRLRGGKVVVKTLEGNSEFVTLDGQSRKVLAGKDLMICDGEGPVAIAGVMGGGNSEVDETTTDIFLESAWFEPTLIRATGKQVGLKTDANYRFERGADPHMALPAALRAIGLILELAGGEASAPHIVSHRDFPHQEVRLDLKSANRLMGTTFGAEEVGALLACLDIEMEPQGGDIFKLRVPPYRVDVYRPQDVMEEILRIYGYNRVPLSGTAQMFMDTEQRPEPHRVRQRWFDFLAGNGWSEIVTNPLVPAKHHVEGTSVRLLNNLSEDLAVLRTSMVHTGLEVLSFNQNRKNGDLALFEHGKTYHMEGEGFKEREWVVFFLMGAAQGAHWSSGKARPSTFFTLVREMERMQAWFGVKGSIEEMGGDETFDFGLVLKGGGEKPIARFGRVNARLQKEWDLRNEVFLAEVDWTQLWRQYQKGKIEYKEMPKYPSIRRDISMLVPSQLKYQAIREAIYSCNPKMIREVGITDVYQGDKIEAGKKSYLLNLTLLDEQKTLTDDAVDKVMSRVFQKLEQDLGAEIRK